MNHFVTSHFIIIFFSQNMQEEEDLLLHQYHKWETDGPGRCTCCGRGHENQQYLQAVTKSVSLKTRNTHSHPKTHRPFMTGFPNLEMVIPDFPLMKGVTGFTSFSPEFPSWANWGTSKSSAKMVGHERGNSNDPHKEFRVLRGFQVCSALYAWLYNCQFQLPIVEIGMKECLIPQ